MSAARSAAVLAVLLLAGVAADAHALTTFKVVPIRIKIDAKAKSATFRIVNEGQQPVTVQLEAKRWIQDGAGQDEYEPTEDLIFFPRIATIPAGQEKVVRVGFKGKVGGRELAYRVFAAELPVSEPGKSEVKLAITIAVPVFVPAEKPFLVWDLEAEGMSDGRVRLKVVNGGNTHVVLARLVAVGVGDKGEVFSREVSGWYTLPGGSKRYAIGIPEADCLKARSIRVEASTDKEKKQVEVPVRPGMCAPLAPDPRSQRPDGAKPPEAPAGPPPPPAQSLPGLTEPTDRNREGTAR
jgi:fimbrial chaperone protein